MLQNNFLNGISTANSSIPNRILAHSIFRCQIQALAGDNLMKKKR